MSKIIFSTNKESYNIISKSVSNEGLNRSFNSLSNSNYISSYCKKSVNIYKNHFRSGNDFICIVGTYLYNYDIGENVLKDLLKEFTGNIENFKIKVFGVYSVVIHKFDKYYIFNDYYGLNDLFYENDFTKDLNVSNSLQSLVYIVNNISVNAEALIHEIKFSPSFSSDTYFSSISRLKGNEYIVIENDKYSINTIQMNTLKNKFKNLKQSEIKDNIIDIIGRIIPAIKSKFTNASLCMTGGLDSRLILAAMLKNNLNPKLIYGSSSSLLTPTVKEDYNIVLKISENLNLQRNIENWNHQLENVKSDLSLQSDLFSKVGFYNKVYSGNINFFKFLNNLDSKNASFIEFGYFIESIRLREYAEKNINKTFSLKNFVFDYYMKGKVKLLPLNDYIYSKWKEVSSSLNIKDIDNISINDFEKLRWSSARYSDSVIANLVNNYTYSFPIFSLPILHEQILMLKAEDIRDSKFQISLIKSIYPELLDFDIFSHRRSFKLRGDVKEKKFTLKNIADYIFEKIPFIKQFIVKIYRYFKYSNTDRIINVIKFDIENLLKENKKLPNLVDSFDGLKELSAYRQFLIAYNYILNNKSNNDYNSKNQ